MLFRLVSLIYAHTTSLALFLVPSTIADGLSVVYVLSFVIEISSLRDLEEYSLTGLMRPLFPLSLAYYFVVNDSLFKWQSISQRQRCSDQNAHSELRFGWGVSETCEPGAVGLTKPEDLAIGRNPRSRNDQLHRWDYLTPFKSIAFSKLAKLEENGYGGFRKSTRHLSQALCHLIATSTSLAKLSRS